MMPCKVDITEIEQGYKWKAVLLTLDAEWAACLGGSRSVGRHAVFQVARLEFEALVKRV